MSGLSGIGYNNAIHQTLWGTVEDAEKARILDQYSANSDDQRARVTELLEQWFSGNYASVYIDQYDGDTGFSKKIENLFPDLRPEEADRILASQIQGKVERIHKLVGQYGIELDIIELEIRRPTFVGTKLLEEYLDHRNKMVVWSEFAKAIESDIGEDYSKFCTLGEFRKAASEFSQWCQVNADQLSSIERISLIDCGLTLLPSEIGLLTNLEHLHLDNNHLVFLPSEIANLRKLKQLHLGNNDLAVLLSEIGQLTELEELNLHNNELKTLPGEIGLLGRLQKLNLGNNFLIAVPSQIGLLLGLAFLNLKKNYLPSLPQEIGNCKALTSLNLSENKLLALPPTMRKLIHLNILMIQDNPLISVPYGLVNLKKFGILKTIFLDPSLAKAFD